MARLAGVDLPRNKRMEVALTYIYGIGPARSKQLLKETGISPDLRTDNLTDEQIASLRDVIEATWKVEGDLRRQVQADIRRKIEIGCYQGLRHRRGLPVRGQRLGILRPCWFQGFPEVHAVRRPAGRRKRCPQGNGPWHEVCGSIR